MAYLFLSLALMAGTVKGYCGKRTGGHLSGSLHAMRATVLRMLLCTLIGFVMLLLDGGIHAILPNTRSLVIFAVSGASTALVVISWLISVKESAYMMLDVSLMLGATVPIVLGLLLFDEKVSLLQWLGLCILVGATVLMISYNNSVKTKMTAKALLLLFVCGLSSGLADFSQKWFVEEFSDVPVSVFNLYTYAFCAIFTLIALLIVSKKENDAPAFPTKRVFPFILVMAICLFLNSYFKTVAAKTLDAALLYPLSQGATLILSSLMSVFFFKERLTLKGILGITLCFVGLVVINVLG